MKRDKLIAYRWSRTQAEMAKKYDVTQQSWSLWEAGTTAPPVGVMKEIEVDSGVPMEDIFFDKFNKM